jgi:hypothetical protein
MRATRMSRHRSLPRRAQIEGPVSDACKTLPLDGRRTAGHGYGRVQERWLVMAVCQEGPDPASLRSEYNSAQLSFTPFNRRDAQPGRRRYCVHRARRHRDAGRRDACLRRYDAVPQLSGDGRDNRSWHGRFNSVRCDDCCYERLGIAAVVLPNHVSGEHASAIEL